MATTTLPMKKEKRVKEVIKPSRSMTHPLQNPKAVVAHGAKRKVKQGEPFDPEDLSRRLQAHLVEQKAKAERRRDAKAAKTAKEVTAAAVTTTTITASSPITSLQDHTYHHVPMVAAAAFQRTATPEILRQKTVHKLSQPALRVHLEHLTIDDPPPGQPSSSLKRTQAMDQAMIDRELLRNRNQFQWDQLMEEAREIDDYRDVYRPPQRTFDNQLSRTKSRREKKNPRPLSTGDVLSEDEVHEDTKTKLRTKPTVYDFRERNDWEQRDNDLIERNNIKKKEKEKEALPLKKKPSSWILMGRRSPKSPKMEKEEAIPAIGDLASPTDGNKSGKAGFLARVKRHPS